ncbi:hypothetical protein PMZ80_007103 [Knufia obscura]|uniref:Uncharacterized protein n=2 Tax=Knufia TaxID=430999 RepID=A0AAN8EVH5_9EURO|nr:hypothetical protein PMZ80_007103 [Knufia obscura]KAK5953113.1 hypothetical protein OHC33_005681 [Knufia fluminis]
MRSPKADSWIDISSRPSSSSLASQNDRVEIITTGLQIRRDDARRPRQLRLSSLQAQPRSTSAAGSSQDEYEESESESDRVLSSSNEDVSNTSNPDEEEDDTQTALGMLRNDHNVFTPQPNIFSHPPSARAVSSSMPADSYFPPQQQAPPISTHRIPSNRVPTIQRPSHQRAASNITPDHDAALRASLTTLLSCANAVRKEREPEPTQAIRRSNQPTALRLVPESELNAQDRHPPPHSPKIASKRKSRESSKERQAKKFRAISKHPHPTPEEMLVSPTMMTWFISAGVVIVFSTISFAAGYAWGKEVGRIEGQMSLDGASCGREAIRGSRTGLSKLRLSAVSA